MSIEVLGTGLTGLVGSRITELLPRYDFVNLSRNEGVDIRDLDALARAVDTSPASVLIHLAAFTDVGAAWKQNGDKSGECYQVNVIGARNVAHVCAQYGRYLIHFSTDFVFQGENNKPYSETDRPDVDDLGARGDWYGRTKLRAEQEVQAAGGKFCIVRIAYPFRSGYERKADQIAQLLNGLKAGKLYPMFADKIITPTFIDDIALAVDRIIQAQPQGIYHVAGASFVSHYELAQKVARTFGYDESRVQEGSLAEYRKTHQPPEFRPYPRCLEISGEKAERELGIGMRTIDGALLEMKRQMEEA